MLDQLRPGTRKARIWLALFIGLLVLQVVAFIISQAGLYRVYSANSATVSDNQTWVVSQLEVDHQNLKIRLLMSELETAFQGGETVSESSWSEIKMAFDIYYSRVKTTKNQLSLLKAKGDVPEQYSNHIATILNSRDELARIIDSAETPDRELIRRLTTMLDNVAEPVRSLALDTVFLLSQQADLERKAAQNYFFFHLAVAFLTVSLLITASVAILVMLHDSRRQNQRLERLLSSQDKTFQQIPRAFVLTDGEGKILRSNRAFEALLGWSEREVQGRKLWDLLPKKRRAAWQSAENNTRLRDLRAGDSTTIREILIDKTERRLPVEVSIIHLQNAGSSVYLLMMRSIALEQRAMRALRRDRTEARKRAYLNSRLLSVMSHEMRTPLHGVIAALDLLKREDLAPDEDELATVALEASQTALKYSNQALDLVGLEFDPSNATQSEFSPAEVVHQVSEMLRPAATSKGNVITTEVDDDLDGIVLGYAELVRHSLSNLLSNAVKFTENGQIDVRLTSLTDGNQLKIEVADTGIGISETQKEDIFSDYVTYSDQSHTQWQSTGLGLSLFKRAVSGMGGNWGVSSQLGQGSTFWFTFPVEGSDASGKPHPAPSDETIDVLPEAFRVLAVDDNPINLALLGKMLAELGVKHDLARNGQEAVETARQTCFDAILMDISMPGMDGYETTKEIRKGGASRHAAIVAFTADTSVEASCEMFVTTGLNDVLLKPVTLDTLRNKLGQLAGRQQDGRAQSLAESVGTTEDMIDRKVVERFAAVGGLEDLLPLIQKLLDQADAVRSSVEPGSENKGATLSAQFHDLSGAAAMMGAGRLAKAARDCEVAVARGSDEQPDLFAFFRETVDATRDEFSALKEQLTRQARP